MSAHSAVAFVGRELGIVQQVARDRTLHHLQHWRDLFGLRGQPHGPPSGVRFCDRRLQGDEFEAVDVGSGSALDRPLSDLIAVELPLEARRPEAALPLRVDSTHCSRSPRDPGELHVACALGAQRVDLAESAEAEVLPRVFPLRLPLGARTQKGRQMGVLEAL